MFEEAAIYRACFLASNGNLGPRDADLLTFWEIAVIIGIPTPEFPADDEPDAKGRRSAPDHRARAHELNMQRLAHSKGRGPAPEARPVDQTALNQMSAALS